MQDWKQAFRLAMFELKASKGSFLALFLFFLLMLFFFKTVLDYDLDKKTGIFDIFVFYIFSSFMMLVVKRKGFQIAKINEDVIASPSFVMLSQLAIKKDTIIKSRFIIHFVYSFPFQLVFLICLYPLTPGIQHALPVSSYIGLAVIWLSFSFYFGYGFPASEAGIKGTVKATILSYAMIMAGLLIIIFIPILSGYSIFYWTIILSRNWPLASSLVSIILAILGVIYWMHYARKSIEKFDYL
ncbi:hypothetical protein F3157_14045 [Virgibacillus dakarensis]|uniref:Uncharacterized protein n=1 Tax=Lentibacillus populi TaxID=1827502 RepID=A0A9W5X4U6_9BACI|nr:MULTISPECIES: hypothetical protein [Bacillaceae]MBT2217291.1 hypothetical protein [Virgibacillus dakarensis]MTW86774.1 hypothetical protein [Virgibacillus dakarensis]GGB38259.1 hypothetical protein GCM10011409_14680 [Lentibacillus populi]